MRVQLALCAVMIFGACAAGQRASDEAVTRADLAATGETFVYDALRSLRPSWIRRTPDQPELGIARRSGGPPPPASARDPLAMAYMGDERAREEDLRRLPVLNIVEVRLIPPRARRPDGSRCDHDRPAIHVVPVG